MRLGASSLKNFAFKEVCLRLLGCRTNRKHAARSHVLMLQASRRGEKEHSMRSSYMDDEDEEHGETPAPSGQVSF